MIIVQNPRLVSILCTLARSCRNIRIRFHPNLEKVLFGSECNPWSKLEWRYYFSIFLATGFAFQCALKNRMNPIETVTAWLCLIMLVAGQCYVIELRRKATEIRDCVNALFQLDRIIPGESKEEGSSIVIVANLAFIYVSIPSAVVLPIVFVYGLHLMHPCKPTLAGYWIIRECYSNKASENLMQVSIDFLLRSGIFLVSHWMWSLSVHAGVIFVCLIQSLFVLSIQQLIGRFEEHRTIF